MNESTYHSTPGRHLRLHRDGFSTAVSGYLISTVSWRLQVDPAQCDCCGSEVHGPVTVRWLHGLHDADVDNLLKIEGRDGGRLVEIDQNHETGEER